MTTLKHGMVADINLDSPTKGNTIMNTTLYATFDGEVLRPDLPVRLPPNTRVRVVIETAEEDESNAVSFLDTAQGLNLEGPEDWSSRLDDYLYGEAGRAD